MENFYDEVKTINEKSIFLLGNENFKNIKNVNIGSLPKAIEKYLNSLEKQYNLNSLKLYWNKQISTRGYDRIRIEIKLNGKINKLYLLESSFIHPESNIKVDYLKIKNFRMEDNIFKHIKPSQLRIENIDSSAMKELKLKKHKKIYNENGDTDNEVIDETQSIEQKNIKIKKHNEQIRRAYYKKIFDEINSLNLVKLSIKNSYLNYYLSYINLNCLSEVKNIDNKHTNYLKLKKLIKIKVYVIYIHKYCLKQFAKCKTFNIYIKTMVIIY